MEEKEGGERGESSPLEIERIPPLSEVSERERQDGHQPATLAVNTNGGGEEEEEGEKGEKGEKRKVEGSEEGRGVMGSELEEEGGGGSVGEGSGGGGGDKTVDSLAS